MDLRKADDDLAPLRRALLGEQSDAVIDLLYGLNMRRPVVPAPAAAALAHELGWVDAGATRLVGEGWLVADSCREYRFWQARSGRLPFQDQSDRLPLETFRGRDVLEIGSGMGANLLSLGPIARRAAGVEPGQTYLRCGRVLSEREGLDPPEARPGSAEAIPYPDADFDIVLCVSAHYYFDIHAALREIRRVLRPGGELVIIGGHFGKWIGGAARAVRADPRALKAELPVLINTLGYMAFGTRLLAARGAFTTARPVYPGIASLCRWIERAGFRLRERGSPISDERLFRAVLPDRPAPG